MATIGTFKRTTDGSYAGDISTLTLQRRIRLVPTEATGNNVPDLRAFAGPAEIGVAWAKISRGGEPYFAVKLDDPSFQARSGPTWSRAGRRPPPGTCSGTTAHPRRQAGGVRPHAAPRSGGRARAYVRRALCQGDDRRHGIVERRALAVDHRRHEGVVVRPVDRIGLDRGQHRPRDAGDVGRVGRILPAELDRVCRRGVARQVRHGRRIDVIAHRVQVVDMPHQGRIGGPADAGPLHRDAPGQRHQLLGPPSAPGRRSGSPAARAVARAPRPQRKLTGSARAGARSGL